MLFHRQHTTTEAQPSIPYQFSWRDGGSVRTSNLTGFMDYTGLNMPRGQYLQAGGGRWVHQSQFVKWVQ